MIFNGEVLKMRLSNPWNSLAPVPVLLIASLMLFGCSMTVPRDEVYGMYIASYPFGRDSITLNRDGSFTQRVALENEQPLIIHGKWEFDDKESRVNFEGALVVTDGFDHLRDDWKLPGIVSLPVERHWFRVEMDSAATHPYFKQ